MAVTDVTIPDPQEVFNWKKCAEAYERDNQNIQEQNQLLKEKIRKLERSCKVYKGQMVKWYSRYMKLKTEGEK